MATVTRTGITDPSHPDYDCKQDPNVKVNWDGDCISSTKPWLDEKLFSVSDFDFTLEDAAIGTAALIGIASLAGAISSYIAWRRRKAIAAGARRASAGIRRMSTTIGNTAAA